MKPEELRSGNYYLSTKYRTPVKCELSDLCEIYHHADGAEPDEDDVAYIFEPIPLTEQWLGDFGFVKHEDTEVVWTNNKDFDVLLYKGTCTVDFDFLTVNSLTTHIKYVHQLQNLFFALTGKELTK